MAIPQRSVYSISFLEKAKSTKMQYISNIVPFTIIGTELATNSYKGGTQNVTITFQISYIVQISFLKKMKEGGKYGRVGVKKRRREETAMTQRPSLKHWALKTWGDTEKQEVLWRTSSNKRESCWNGRCYKHCVFNLHFTHTPHPSPQSVIK